jgi:hypothetical protein
MTINLSEVPQKESFPVIGFKFRNTGHAKTVLWKFHIEVLSATVDIAPVMRFYYEVGPREEKILRFSISSSAR